MNNTIQHFCRLCLSIVNFNEVSDICSNGQLYKTVQELFPGMNLRIIKHPKVCISCLKMINLSLIFKESVLENEFKINKDITIGTNVESFCRLCLTQPTNNDETVCMYDNCNYSYNLVRIMTEIATSHLNFNLSQKPIICANCWSAVKQIYKFKRNCFKVEGKLEMLSKEEENISDQDIILLIERNMLMEGNLNVWHSIQKCEPNTNSNKQMAVQSTSFAENHAVPIRNHCKREESSSNYSYKEKSRCITDEGDHLVIISDSDDEQKDEEIVSDDSDDIFEEDIRNMPTENSNNTNATTPNNVIINSEEQIYEANILPEPIRDVTNENRNVYQEANTSEIILKNNYVHSNKSQPFWYDSKSNTYVCSSCGYNTQLEYSIKRHMKMHDKKKEKKIFTCDHCDFETKYKCSINKHIKLRHLNTFRCGECGFVTSQKNTMLDHNEKHRKFIKSKNTCQNCNIFSQNPEILENHICVCANNMGQTT